MIIDTHAHIDQLEDLPGALERAHEAGVSDIIGMSVDLDSMKKLLGIKAQYQAPRIHPALGVHPGLVSDKGGDVPGGKPPDLQAAFDFMRAHIKEASAVGETGLDYWYKWVRKDLVERQKQKDSFAFHLDLSREFDLPIVIHSRGAWRDCLEMTLQAGIRKALFHWYSGPLDTLAEIIEAGFYVSTSPSVAYSPESRRAMAEAPINRILVETDSPVRYYPPKADQPLADKEGEVFYSAEPKDVVRTWKALAQLKNLDEQETLGIINANAKQFFGLI